MTFYNRHHGFPCAGTSPYYRHGRDVPITRATIALAQLRREADGKAPFSPHDIVREFVRIPCPRHYRRAESLMGR